MTTKLYKISSDDCWYLYRTQQVSSGNGELWVVSK